MHPLYKSTMKQIRMQARKERLDRIYKPDLVRYWHCPVCGAGRGELCTGPRWRPLKSNHIDRVMKVAKWI